MSGEAQMQARSDVKFPNVRGVVLAGVHAWGDCVLEQTACRPMLPVAARPLLWHALTWVRRGGVLEASICGNSDTALFRRTFGTGEALGISLEYSEDVMPRGPAGCVRDAAHDTGADAIVVVGANALVREPLPRPADPRDDTQGVRVDRRSEQPNLTRSAVATSA